MSETVELVKVDVLADIAHPQEFPWPYDDGSVNELTCGGILEYVPGKMRGRFMDEVYRILAPDGKAAFSVPYWSSFRAVQDYRYEWPPFSEQSFLYFNKGWREVNKLELGLACDFDFTYGYTWEPETVAKSDEVRAFNTKHYANSVDMLHFMLTKRCS